MPGPSSSMVITTRSGPRARCTVALVPYLIALSTRLLIARRRAIGRQLIATPRAPEAWFVLGVFLSERNHRIDHLAHGMEIGQHPLSFRQNIRRFEAQLQSRQWSPEI